MSTVVYRLVKPMYRHECLVIGTLYSDCSSAYCNAGFSMKGNAQITLKGERQAHFDTIVVIDNS